MSARLRRKKRMRAENVYRYLRALGIHNAACRALDPDVNCVCPWGGPS